MDKNQKSILSIVEDSLAKAGYDVSVLPDGILIRDKENDQRFRLSLDEDAG